MLSFSLSFWDEIPLPSALVEATMLRRLPTAALVTLFLIAAAGANTLLKKR